MSFIEYPPLEITREKYCIKCKKIFIGEDNRCWDCYIKSDRWVKSAEEHYKFIHRKKTNY